MAIYEFGNWASGTIDLGNLPAAFGDFRDTTQYGHWNPPDGYGAPGTVTISAPGQGPNGGFYGSIDCDDRNIWLTQDKGRHVRTHLISLRGGSASWMTDGGTGYGAFSFRFPSGSQYTIPQGSAIATLELHGGSGAQGVAPFLVHFWRGSDGKLHCAFVTTGGVDGSNAYTQQYTFGPAYPGQTFNPGVEFHQAWTQANGQAYPSFGPSLDYDIWHHFRFDWHFSSAGAGTFKAQWFDPVALQWVSVVPTKTGLYTCYPASTGGLGPFMSNYYDSQYTGPPTYQSQSDEPPAGRNRNRYDSAAGAFADGLSERDSWQATRLGSLIAPGGGGGGGGGGGTGTIGLSTPGGVFAGGATDGLDVFGAYALPVTATSSKLTAYVDTTHLVAAAKVRPVIYVDNGSIAPGNLVAVGPEVTVPAGQAASWVDFPITASLTGSTSYWFGFWYADANLTFYYMPGGGHESYKAGVAYSPSGNPTSPFGAPTVTGTDTYSIYLTYSTGTGSTTFTDAATGTIGLSGSSTSSFTAGTTTFNDSGTGTITLSGSSVESYDDTPPAPFSILMRT